MSKTITLSLPHDLSQLEARSRIQKGLAEFQASHAARISHVEQRWSDNHLDFSLHAVGQSIRGALDVLDHEIRLAIDLPWMLALLAGTFTKRVEEEGRRMLGKK